MALGLLFDSALPIMKKKKDPTDKKAAKKTPARKASKSPVQPPGGKTADDAPAGGTAASGGSAKPPRKAIKEMTPDEAEAAYGTWAVLAGPQSEEEAREMVDELWLLLNDPAKLRKRNIIGNIMGIHEGRKPEKVHLHIRPGKSVAKVRSRQWHPTEDWRENPDGSLDYWLEIAPCWQMRVWVMGFVGDARVVSPPAFRAFIHDHCAEIAEKYARPPEV